MPFSGFLLFAVPKPNLFIPTTPFSITDLDFAIFSFYAKDKPDDFLFVSTSPEQSSFLCRIDALARGRS